MNHIEESYWNLLKAGLWNDKRHLDGFSPLSDKEWRKVISLAQKSGATGLIGDAIKMLPETCMPCNEDITEALLVKMANLIKLHEKHNIVIGHLMSLLDEMGVKGALLKGQGLAQNFENPESRNVGDIDVFIGAEPMETVVNRLKELGYTCEEEINDTDQHVVFIFEDITVELHRESLYLYTPKTDRIYQEWWDNTLFNNPLKAYIDKKGKWHKKEVSDSQCILLPETTLNVFFTFCHLFNHYMKYHIQFKQFMDLARLLKMEKDNIDIELLGNKLKKTGMLEPWQVMGCYIHKKLELEINCIPFYNGNLEQKAEKFGRQIHERIFNKQTTSAKWPKNRISSKLYSFMLNIKIAIHTSAIFPKLSLYHLFDSTIRGIRLLSNPDNRPVGTPEHYLSRRQNSSE